MLEVTYTLEKNDYLRYSWFVIGRTPGLKWQAILRFFGLPLFNLVVLFIFHTAPVPYLLNAVGVTSLWVGYLWWAHRQAVISLAQARTGDLGLHTVSLQPDGLYNQTSILETRVKWQNITEVADSPQIIALFLSPRFGFIVPKRAFADPAQASAFLETARAYHRSAYDGSEPALPPVPASWPPAPQRIL